MTEEMPASNRKPRFFVLGGLVLIIVLAAAAFLAGRLMNQPAALSPLGMQIAPGSGPQSAGGPDGGFVINGSKGAESAGGAAITNGGNETIQLQVTPAPELPQTPPDANGLFVKRADNSLFIGTGMISMSVVAGSAGEAAAPEASYDGPQVEIVVTKETLLYRDATTPPDFENPSATIQQKVEPGSLDEFNSQTTLSVWGKKTGDRIVAEVIFYSQPMMIQAPANK